jgi:N-acetylneuraminate synthase
MEADKIGFEIVKPTKEDAFQILQWRNDPETLRMSIHPQAKKWDSFYKEFINDYFLSPALPPLFILLDGQRVAFFLFKPISHPEHAHKRRCVEVSLNVAPEHRNKGIGTAALIATKKWVQHQGFDDIFAKIKIENIASQKAFISAGYELLGQTVFHAEDIQENIPIYRNMARLTPFMENKSIFIIAEAGSNWRMGTLDRDLNMAKTLIDSAAEAGADAVKFQIYRPETIYVANAGISNYLAATGIKKEMQEIFADLAMPYEMIPQLAEYCQASGIEFMATAFSIKDFLAIDPYVRRHKIASYEIGHIRLLESIAQSAKPTFISTGAATENEIAWAVEAFFAYGGKELTLLQCTAKYPAEADSMNLRSILWLKERFKCSVGLSDHSRDAMVAPIEAVALGAKAIEKHFTLDRRLPGPDHAFALNPQELKEMVRAVRLAEQMQGSWVKTIHPSEQELRHFARRGVQALCPISVGQVLQEGVNVDILRPGKQTLGIHPKYLQQIEGKKAARFIPLGDGIQWGDWE